MRREWLRGVALHLRFVVLDLPIPYKPLSFLPVADLQEFANVLAAEETIDPDRTATTTVFPPLSPMITVSSMASIKGEHGRF
jgi:hypothetical protein